MKRFDVALTVAVAVAVTAVCAVAFSASAADWPTRPISHHRAVDARRSRRHSAACSAITSWNRSTSAASSKIAQALAG